MDIAGLTAVVAWNDYGWVHAGASSPTNGRAVSLAFRQCRRLIAGPIAVAAIMYHSLVMTPWRGIREA